MESNQPLDIIITTQDSDVLMQPTQTTSLSQILENQHLHRLSISSLASPLDALALACEAEQRLTVEANHGQNHGSEPDHDNLHQLRSQSPDDSAGHFQGKTFEKAPSSVAASNYVSPDVLETTNDPKARSHSSDTVSVECTSNQYLPNKLFPTSSTNFVSQDYLQEIPSYISLNDVLCGRGGLTNHHPGNIFFRNLVRTRQDEYLRASKRDKANVAKDIVDIIRNQEPPGRFLKKVSENSNTWAEIGDRKAREKTSQALREGAPELRELSLKPLETGFLHGASQLSEDNMLQFPVLGASKDSMEPCKNNLSNSHVVPVSFRGNAFEANIDTISTSSSHSTLPRPRVVSSDSVRSTASGSDGLTDDASSGTQDDALIKRQKVRHRCLTDSGVEDHAIQNLYLPPPIRPPPRLYRTSSDGAITEETEKGIKGPRLKLLKARFQCQKNEAT